MSALITIEVHGPAVALAHAVMRSDGKPDAKEIEKLVRERCEKRRDGKKWTEEVLRDLPNLCDDSLANAIREYVHWERHLLAAIGTVLSWVVAAVIGLMLWQVHDCTFMGAALPVVGCIWLSKRWLCESIAKRRKACEEYVPSGDSVFARDRRAREGLVAAGFEVVGDVVYSDGTWKSAAYVRVRFPPPLVGGAC